MVHAPARKKSLPANGEKLAEDNNDSTEIVPPDGGWGWMVVFGSLMIHIITDGITYSFGLFYTQFVEDFNEGQGYTAWIASTMVGVTYASGPISSSFVNRYGCRAVTIAGAILASFCICISIFAKNVFTLIITIGLGTGFGFGLIYLPAIVSVTQYFEAKRSLATGIAVCGSGFGTFLFSPLTERLITDFGWRGAMLTMGGIVLNCIIFGILFRPLVAPSNNKKADKSAMKDINELHPLKSNKQFVNRLDTPLRSNSIGHAYEFNTNNNSNTYTNGQAPSEKNTSKGNSQEVVRSAISQPHLADDSQDKKYGSGTMYRPDILYQGSLLNIPEYASSKHDLGSNGGVNRYGSLKRRNHPSESEDTLKCCGGVKCSRETRDTFAEMMDFSLLRDGVFIIFTLSNFCTSIGLNVPYIYLDSQAKFLELDKKDSSYLLAIIGIANTVGRIVLGYISDKSWVNRQWVYNACLTICGAATFLSPLCTDFTGLAIYCSVFGFTIGAYVGLTSVILVDLLGLDKLTNAFGLLLLFQGIASIIGAPIGGWLYDFTKSYNPAFYLAGIMILLSGLVMFGIPPLQKSRARKAAQNRSTVHSIS